MRITIFAIFILLGFIQTGQSCEKKTMQNTTNTMTEPTPKLTPKPTTKFDRLPDGITLKTEVTEEVKNEKGEIVSYKTITVEEKLKMLNARYEGEKLVDGKGREIRFFTPLCRGVSRGVEGDSEDQQASENELKELKKKYTVIVLFCDPINVM